MLRGFGLRDFGVSLNAMECYTTQSSLGKIGHNEVVNK